MTARQGRVRPLEERKLVNSSRPQASCTQLDLPLYHTTHTLTMASIIGRAAFRATRPLRASGVNSGAENAASHASREADKQALKQGARKDPELYVRRQFLYAL